LSSVFFKKTEDFSILGDGVLLVALHNRGQRLVAHAGHLAHLGEVNHDLVLKPVDANHAVNQLFSQFVHFFVLLSLSDYSIAQRGLVVKPLFNVFAHFFYMLRFFFVIGAHAQIEKNLVQQDANNAADKKHDCEGENNLDDSSHFKYLLSFSDYSIAQTG